VRDVVSEMPAISRKAYPSDLTDAEWEVVAPLLPPSTLLASFVFRLLRRQLSAKHRHGHRQ